MPRMPCVTGAEVLGALRRDGWEVDRQRGSHVYLRHPKKPGRMVTVPVHRGELLKPKTFSSILDQAGMAVDDLRKLF